MSTIFISHNSKDRQIAAEIKERLDQQYQSIFLDFDPQDGIPAGRNWERELYRQLLACQAVLVLCSEHSMSSKWCFAEITQARALGKSVFSLKVAPCTIDSILQQEQLIDFTVDREDGFVRLWRGLAEAGLDPRDSFRLPADRSPYPGLTAFAEEDAAVFFGRESAIQQVTELLTRLQRFQKSRFVLLLGASGSGKSSLARAGVLPRLKKNPAAWLVVDSFRPRDQPGHEFALALSRTFDRLGEKRDWRSLRDELERAARDSDLGPLKDIAYDLRAASKASDASIVVTIDQLEELLGRSPDDPSHRFSTLLHRAIESAGSPFLLLGLLRSDFLPVFQSQEPWSRLSCESVPLPPIGVEDYPQLIEKPARLAGLELEQGLVQAMIADAGSGDALPILAFGLRKLWELSGGSPAESRMGGRFTLRQYRNELGGLQGLLVRAAEDAVGSDLDSGESPTTLRKAFSSLVRMDDEGRFVRKSTRWETLPPEAHPALERMIKARLLVTWGGAEGRMVEVAHDALFRAWDRLNLWLKADQEFLLWQKRLQSAAREWERTNKDGGALLRGGLLAEAERWRSERPDGLSSAEGEFMEASVAMRRKERSDAEFREWKARLEAGRAFYERSFVLSDRGRYQSAAACLLRAVELAPPNGAPEGYPSTWGNPSWAREAWTQYRFLDLQRGWMRGRLEGHRAPVTSVAVSPDARIGLSGSIDGEAHLWNLKTLELLWTLPVHSAAVSCVALSSDAKKAVTGSLDGAVYFWDLETAAREWSIKGSGEPVTSVAFSPDGQSILWGYKTGSIVVAGLPFSNPRHFRNHTGSVTYLACDAGCKTILSGSGRPALAEWLGDGSAQVWDTASEKTIRLLPSQLGESITSLAVSANGKVALRGSSDGNIGIWNLETGEKMGTLAGHTGAVLSLVFGSDDRWVLSGSADNTMRWWDIDERKTTLVLEGHKDRVLSVAIDAAAQIALSGSFDETIGVWDLGGPATVARRLEGHTKTVSAISISSDCQRALSGATDNTARLWDLASGEVLRVLGQHAKGVNSVAISADSKTAFSGHEDGAILVWDLATGIVRSVLEGHAEYVWDLAISSDGKILSAGQDKMVRVWDPLTGEQPRILKGHTGAVYGVAWSPQGRFAVSGSGDRTLRVWDLQNYEEIRLLGESAARSNGIVGVAWSREGDRILAATSDGSIEVWHAVNGEKLQVLTGHLEFATKVAFSPDGLLALSGSFDRTVRLWNLENSQALRVFEGHEDHVYGVAFSPDGKVALSGSMDKTIRLWEVDTGTELRKFAGHAEGVSSVAFSPDGKTVLSGSIDKTARLWEVESGRQSRLLQEGHTGEVQSVAFGGNGETAITGSEDGTVRLWSAETGHQLRAFPTQSNGASGIAMTADSKAVLAGYGNKFKRIWDSLAFGPAEGKSSFDDPGQGIIAIWNTEEGNGVCLDRHTDLVSSVTFSSDGKSVLSGSYDGTVRLWDVETGRQLRLLRGHSGRVWSVAFHPRLPIAISGSADFTIRVWDLESGTTVRLIKGHTGAVGSVAFSLEGKAVVSGSADRTISVWSFETGAELRRFVGHSGSVTAIAADSKCQRISSGSVDHSVRVWDAVTGELLYELQGHTGTVWCLAVDSEGRTLVSGSEDATARQWDLQTGRETAVLSGHRDAINGIAISPNGMAVLTASADRTIRLWDLASRQARRSLEAKGGSVLSVSFSPDGNLASSGSEDGVVRVWDLETNEPPKMLGESIGEVLSVGLHAGSGTALFGSADGFTWVWNLNGERSRVLRGHTATVTSVALSPSGEIGLTGSLDGTVRVWDVGKGVSLRVLRGHTKGLICVAFCPDGHSALTSGADATVRLWDIETGKQLRLFEGRQARSLVISPDGLFALITSGTGQRTEIPLGNDQGSFIGLVLQAGHDEMIDTLPLTDPRTPAQPPLVHPEDTEDPYREFAKLYDSVGLRIIREGPNMGEIELA